MDPYLFSAILGGTGLGVMALSGLGAHGHAGHVGHGHGGHGHAGHGHAGSSHGAHAGGARGHGSHLRESGGRALWALASPRILFGLALGFGLSGLLVRDLLHWSGIPLGLVAVAGALLLERGLMTPAWNAAFRFASNPAQMLESIVMDRARVTSSFDKEGCGIVAVELDGQVVQLLATLTPEARALGGPRLRMGAEVRIESVDGPRHRCTVSPLDALPA